MSIQIAVPGVLAQPASTLLTTTDVTDVLTVAAGFTGVTTVIGLVAVNRDSSARIVSFWWNDGATDYPLFERSVPANDTITEALTVPIRLFAKETAKKIKAQAPAGSSIMTVTVVYTQSTQAAQ